VEDVRPEAALAGGAEHDCGSPSQQPSLNRQRGHCHVPCTHRMSALQRQQDSTSVTV
jgi:hypothetical protein